MFDGASGGGDYVNECFADDNDVRGRRGGSC